MTATFHFGSGEGLYAEGLGFNFPCTQFGLRIVPDPKKDQNPQTYTDMIKEQLTYGASNRRKWLNKKKCNDRRLSDGIIAALKRERERKHDRENCLPLKLAIRTVTFLLI